MWKTCIFVHFHDEICIFETFLRGQRVSFGGQKSVFPPTSRKVKYGSGGSTYASKSIPACILRSGIGLDGLKWGPNWIIWLLYGLCDWGVKKSTFSVKNQKNIMGPGRSCMGLVGQNTRPKAFPHAFWGREPDWTAPNGVPSVWFGCSMTYVTEGSKSQF